MMSRRAFLGSGLAVAASAAGAGVSSGARRLVGITTLPEFIQSEGVEKLIENLIVRAGANAVTTSPYVMALADEKTGSREPPIDAGAGGVRLLDRDLFGKRELWVRTAPSFTPDKNLYRESRYQPPEPDELTQREGGKVGQFVQQAKRAGLRVYLQIQAASPPGFRVQFSGLKEDDQPRLVDGVIPPRRVDKNGSLASPHLASYARAVTRDLLRAYPEIDGLRVDWPEYPPYFLDVLFTDFSDHMKSAAKDAGLDFEIMRHDALKMKEWLFGGLSNGDLDSFLEWKGMNEAMERLEKTFPGVMQMNRLKSQLVSGLLRHYREALDEAGARHVELVPNAFPPPWHRLSAFDFSTCLRDSSGVSVKLYSMHWAMMVRFYGDALLAANPGLDEGRLTRVLVHLLDIADDGGLKHLADYHYPEPDEAHPCGTGAIRRKIVEAQRATDKPVYALAHGYGPVEDFRRRLEAANSASKHGFWINRYGYLSDEKLAIVRELSNAR